MNEQLDTRLEQCQQAVEAFLAIQLRPGGNLVEMNTAYVQVMDILDQNQTAGIRVIEYMRDKIDAHFRAEVVRVCRVEKFLYEYQPEYPVEEPAYLSTVEA